MPLPPLPSPVRGRLLVLSSETRAAFTLTGSEVDREFCFGFLGLGRSWTSDMRDSSDEKVSSCLEQRQSPRNSFDFAAYIL